VAGLTALCDYGIETTNRIVACDCSLVLQGDITRVTMTFCNRIDDDLCHVFAINVLGTMYCRQKEVCGGEEHIESQERNV
jgi:hypothetical protein